MERDRQKPHKCIECQVAAGVIENNIAGKKRNKECEEVEGIAGGNFR